MTYKAVRRALYGVALKIKGIGIVIIGMDEIIEGTPAEFRELLKNKLGSRFRLGAK